MAKRVKMVIKRIEMRCPMCGEEMQEYVNDFRCRNPYLRCDFRYEKGEGGVMKKEVKGLDSLGFKFRVGEIVRHKLKMDRWQSGKEENFRSNSLLIIGRRAEECSGSGVQLMYMVRVGFLFADVMSFDHTKTVILHEIELERITGGSLETSTA
jgi:hypothetical protein